MKELFLDTETTGSWLSGDPFSHTTSSGSYYYWDDLTEVAICDADGNEVYRRYVRPKYKYLKSISNWYPAEKPIDEKNTDWRRVISEGIKPDQLVKELASILKGARVVVHNLSFDSKVIADSYAVHSGASNQVVLGDLFPDTEFVCSKIRAGRTLPKATEHYPNCGTRCNGHRLTHLHHQFGFGDYDEHDPLADVQALAKVWSVLTAS